jgi:hypothetical protein
MRMPAENRRNSADGPLLWGGSAWLPWIDPGELMRNLYPASTPSGTHRLGGLPLIPERTEQ